MNKKTRLLIVIFCLLAFFIAAPYIIMYSLGYRIDFEHRQIVATGGIYVRTFPTADQIIVDSKIKQKPGMFNGSIFAQSLIPKDHSVLVTKDGYFDYYKVLPVKKNKVTKLESVLLIKKELAFSALAENINLFSMAPNGRDIAAFSWNDKGVTLKYFPVDNASQTKEFSVAKSGKANSVKWADDSNRALIEIQNSQGLVYYLFDPQKQAQNIVYLSALDKFCQSISFDPQNSQQIFFIKNKSLYSLKNNTATLVIKNVLAYKIFGSSITWLSTKGAFLKSDLSGKLQEELLPETPSLTTQKVYDILSIANKTYLRENDNLYLYNSSSKTLENLGISMPGYQLSLSPNSQTLAYYNEKNIYLYSFDPLAEKNNVKIFTAENGERISKLFWINKDYLVFNSGNRIIVSEIDYQGNINAVEIKQAESPEILFNTADQKLYIFSNNTLVSSERLTP